MTDETNSLVSDSQASSPVPSSGGVLSDDNALKLMSVDTSDVGDYIEERRFQDARGNGDATAYTSETKEKRLERIKRSLDAARSAGVDPFTGREAVDGGENEQAQTEDSGAREQQIREQAQKEARFDLRARELDRHMPEARHQIAAVLEVFPLGETLEQEILDSPYGPQILYEMSNIPQAIDEINRKTPREIAKIVSFMEGRYMENARGASAAPQAPAPRTRTKAPPPLRTLTGGATPKADIHQLAKNDDVSAYVAERRRQGGRR